MSVYVERVLAASGVGANYHEDLAVLRAGAVVRDGEFLDGTPTTPGFRRVQEPGEALSILLLLSDGQVAQGDCTSVVFSGFGGRDPVFRASDGADVLKSVLDPWLVGLDATQFRASAEALEASFSAGDRRVHTALRYGVSQALLHAAALARRQTMAEVVQTEYGIDRPMAAVPIMAQSGRERFTAVDRMIMRRVQVLPHGDFTTVKELGPDGETLLSYVRWLRTRVRTRGGSDYRPSFHIDLYGTAGDLVGGDPTRVAQFLIALEQEAAPFALAIECPLVGSTQQETIDKMSALIRALRSRGSSVTIVADEFCNTVADVTAFATASAAHMVQVKTPDLGSLSEAIRAVEHCHDVGLRAFLGGSCNETDWSARVTVHVAIATSADQIYNKPGLGVDEGYMIVRNEMSRVLALLEHTGSVRTASAKAS